MLKLEIENLNIEKEINPKRVCTLNDIKYKKGCVVYWMQRDQRAFDNPALLLAQELAFRYKERLIVVFNLAEPFLNVNFRKYKFMLEGLKKLENSLNDYNIPFYILRDKNIIKFLKKQNAGFLVADFNPLKTKIETEKSLFDKLDIPFVRVDAHNICPALYVSEKKEYSARTLRIKIQRALVEFLTVLPDLRLMPSYKLNQNNWDEIYKNLKVDEAIKPVNWLVSGEKEASAILKKFIDKKLKFYDKKRNNPNEDATSNLSVYLNLGQISAQRVAIEVIKSNASKKVKEAFLEELIVRKELSDNYCYYEKNYDNTKGFNSWALDTLKEYNEDIREYIYTKEEFENAKTHDKLWNAAQIQMVKTGKMHGYLRMYWAKKILEWTKSYVEAFDIALYLNDKYELDGADPNGYVGIAWAIGGVHDRAWAQREIFGKIRYMSFNGCKNKFDVEKYISKVKML